MLECMIRLPLVKRASLIQAEQLERAGAAFSLAVGRDSN
jgi:hypothetical protein